MILFPAIDLKDGNCVRLKLGDMEQATVFNADPAAQARTFEAQGFAWLHIVDLNGAFAGRPVNADAVESVLGAVTIPVQLGGGIRDMATIEMWLDKGVRRVILGTVAVRDPDLVRQAAEKLGSDKVTVAIDARRNAEMPSGFELVVSGGTKPVGKDAVEWAKRCQELAVGSVLPTSMDGDGTQAGYDLEFTRAISDAVTVPVVASGGAGNLEHFYEAVKEGGAQVLLAASVFHYRTLSIRQVKEFLRDKGLQVVL